MLTVFLHTLMLYTFTVTPTGFLSPLFYFAFLLLYSCLVTGNFGGIPF